MGSIVEELGGKIGLGANLRNLSAEKMVGDARISKVLME